MKSNVWFLTGTDTGVGKTFVTGRLASLLHQNGIKVITQKPVQTGSVFPAEDICVHRQMCGVRLNEDDSAGITASYVFPFPASPHLSAGLAGGQVDIRVIDRHTAELSAKYSVVIQEGAGGLMVPLNDSVLSIDYAAERGYGILFVASSRLGGINHSLLSFEAMKKRGMRLSALIYNDYPAVHPEIAADSRRFIFGAFAETFGECGAPCLDASALIYDDIKSVFDPVMKADNVN